MSLTTSPALSPTVRFQRALDAAVPDLANALPPGVPVTRFKAVVATAVLHNPDLLDLMRSEGGKASMWKACRQAAQAGLMPDGKEGAIIARWDKRANGKLANFQPMVFGIIQQAKRKGNVASLVANVVYQGEHFEVLMGDEDRIVHRRDLSKVGKGKEAAVYAIATLKDGTKEREVMTWEQVMQVRAVGADKGPWVQWPDEMARKTVIRRLAKRLPILDDGDAELMRSMTAVDALYDFKPQPGPAIDAEADADGMIEHQPDTGEHDVADDAQEPA